MDQWRKSGGVDASGSTSSDLITSSDLARSRGEAGIPTLSMARRSRPSSAYRIAARAVRPCRFSAPSQLYGAYLSDRKIYWC